MADVMLKNAAGEKKTYEGIETVTLPTSDGGTATFTLEGSGNPDWAQTDASAKDYIKNKPFGDNADGTVTQLDNKYIAALEGNVSGEYKLKDSYLPDSAATKQDVSDAISEIDIPEVAQADWNEANADSPAYIKNKPTTLGGGASSWNDLTDKPFGEIDVVPEQEVPFEISNNENTARLSYVQGSTDWFDEGKTYKVTWNGVEYSGTIKCVTEFNNGLHLRDDMYYIGNPAVEDAHRVGNGYDAAGWVDTGEPFFMYSLTIPCNSCIVTTTDTTKDAHTIRIVEEKKIDDKWLSDIPHFNLIEMGLGDILIGNDTATSVDVDTTEILEALNRGPIKLTFRLDGKVTTATTSSLVQDRVLDEEVLGCSVIFSAESSISCTTFLFFKNVILAHSYVGELLPAVSVGDDGKVLSVKDGVWVAADAPAGNGGGLSTDKDILAETTVALTNVIEEFGLYGGGKMGWFSLQEGAIYNVRWGDDVYTLETFSYAMNGIEAVVLGNRNYIVDGDTEISEPFVIYYIPAEDYGVIVSAMDTEPASHIVRIYQSIDFIDRDEMIQFVDEKLANIGGGFEQVQVDWDETDVTSPSYIKNKPIISADGTTTVQSNYNQNDSTQADYIKNRPFYVDDEVTTEVLPATTLPFDFSESDGVYAFYMQPTTEYTELWQSDWSKMILTWGETVYECEPKEVMGMKVIGNVDAMLGTGNTEEPFVMGILEPPAIPQRMMVIIDLESAPAEDGSVPTVLRNIAVSMVSREIHTIDPKFIADVPWDKISNKPFGDLAAGSVVVDETVTLGAAGAITPLTTINVSNMIVGAEYNITIGDATFIGYCVDANGFIVIATDDFKIAVSEAIGGMSCDSIDGLTEGAVYHVKVTLASDEVLKIDAKYLPSGLPDSSASDSGKVLTVGDDGAVTWSEPVSGLPDITTDVDEGKFLRVVGGVAQWVSIPNGEEATF